MSFYACVQGETIAAISCCRIGHCEQISHTLVWRVVHNLSMESSAKMVQIVRIALMMSILLYVFVGERMAVTPARAPKPMLLQVFTLVAVMTVIMIFVMRRVLVLRSENAIASEPGDVDVLNRWQAGHIVTYALSESIALYGLVLRFLGFSLSHVASFYIAGFLLLLFFGPRHVSSRVGG
jgi:hypothetical protein